MWGVNSQVLFTRKSAWAISRIRLTEVVVVATCRGWLLSLVAMGARESNPGAMVQQPRRDGSSSDGLLATACAPRPGRAGQSVNLQTSFGPVACQLVGSEGAQLVVALQGSAQFNIAEWDRAANALAHGPNAFRVLLPNFHSNASTAPGAARFETIEKVLLEVLPKKQRIILAGKSWGGAMAATFAAAHPDLVEKLVLVAPALADKAVLSKLSMPVFLAWAQDDGLVPYRNAQVYQESCSRLTLHSAASGGHKILDAYSDLIVRFVGSK